MTSFSSSSAHSLPGASPLLPPVSGWSSIHSNDALSDINFDVLDLSDDEMREALLGDDSSGSNYRSSPQLSPGSPAPDYLREQSYDNCQTGSGISRVFEDESPSSPRQLLFRAELEFLVQTSGEAGAKVTAAHPKFVGLPSSHSNLGAHHLQFRIVERLREAGFFSLANSADSETQLHALEHGQALLDLSNLDSDDGFWKVKVNKEDLKLPEKDSPEHDSYVQTWKLVRVCSPLMSHPEKNLNRFDLLLQTLQDTPNFIIGMNHIPRLRVEIKPRNEDFRLTDLKKIVSFLWAASPRLNQLHAEYCGPASIIAPGLEFTNIFNFLPFTYLSDAEWRGEPAETVFTHGPPILTTTKMLKTPDVMRHSAFAQFAAREISEMDNLESLLEATTIRVKDLEGEIGTLPGAYDFSHLADVDPVQRTIRFAQHAGTMDSDAIKNWIKVCHGLVSFCLDTCKQRVDHIFEQLEVSSAEAYTVYDILKDIDLVSQADYYLDKGPNPFVPDLACHRRIPTVNLADTRDLPPYTFGIEVEFLVPYSHENTPDPYPSDSRWVYRYNPDADQHDPSEDARTVSHSGTAEYLAKMLNKAGHFSVTLYRLLDACNDIEGDRAQALATLAKSSGLNMHLVDKVEPMFQTWLAQPDFSLSSFQSGFLGYSGGITGVELCSPILRDQQTDFGKIVNIVKLIRNNMRPMLNPTCGFHVHVGNVRNFSLLSLKRIVTLIWAADPVLYSLVHPSRRENAYSIPPRKGSKLANNQDLPPYSDVWNLRRDKLLELEIESHVPMDKIPDRLQREIYQIWSAVNERVLIGLVGSPVGARTGISLHRIKPVEDMDTENPAATVYEGTIEFRCLEGTLHPELIVQWVKLLLAIVAKAEASTVWKYFTIMSEVLKEHKSDREQLADFLHVLDLGSAESFWEKTAEMNRTLAVGVVSEDDSNQPSEWEMVFDEGESTRSRYENDTVVVHPLANNEAIGIETNIP